MRTTPPNEEEQPEHADGRQEYTLPQRRSRPGNTRRPRRDYYSDEYPDVPKVRRASLHRDASPADASEEAEAPADELEEDDEREEPTPEETEQDPATHSLLTQRQRTAIYEPPAPRATRRRQSQPTRRLYEPSPTSPPSMRGLQQLHRRPRLLVLGGVALAIVVIALLLANATRTSTIPVPLATPGSTTIEKTPGLIPTGTTNSHELVITPPNSDHPAPPVYATAAYLLDADTGATLYAHNPFMHLPMLSTTKLMTALLAVQQGQPDQKITISDAMANDINQLSADSSVMNIRKGETYTLRELLEGLLLVSGNDAAVVIADQFAGSQQKFVDEMNQMATKLGLHDTHYMNPHGLLTSGHYSSAHDLAVLASYSLSQPLIHEISSTKSVHLDATAEHAEHNFPNGNEFLWWYPGTDGGKPGWDAGTDFVQVVSCVRNHHHLIGVTMHTIDWWTDMRDLMNWGFTLFTWVSPRDAVLNNQSVPFAASWDYFVKDKRENTIPTADHGRYYIATGYSITAPVMNYFDQNNGISILGFPTSQAHLVTTTSISQRFEHGTIQCDLSTKHCKTT